MSDGGSNGCKIPHNDFAKIRKLDPLPISLNCDREVYKVAQIEAERLRNF